MYVQGMSKVRFWIIYELGMKPKEEYSSLFSSSTNEKETKKKAFFCLGRDIYLRVIF